MGRQSACAGLDWIVTIHSMLLVLFTCNDDWHCMYFVEIKTHGMTS